MTDGDVEGNPEEGREADTSQKNPEEPAVFTAEQEKRIAELAAAGWRPKIHRVGSAIYVAMRNPETKEDVSFGRFTEEKWNRINEIVKKTLEEVKGVKDKGVKDEGVREGGLIPVHEAASILGVKETDIVSWIRKGLVKHHARVMSEDGRGYIYMVDIDEARRLAEKGGLPEGLASAASPDLIRRIAEEVADRLTPALRDLVASEVRSIVEKGGVVRAGAVKVKPTITMNVSVPLDAELIAIYEIENENWKRMFPGRGNLDVGLWIAATAKYHYRNCRGYAVAVEVPGEVV
ncbi:MAG: hypothetical protein QW503_04655 [Sulfolobales archaeon]